MKTPPTDLDEGTIRRIDWQELCPAVLLPQAVSIATTFRVLWVASFGVLLTLSLGLWLNEMTSRQAEAQYVSEFDNRRALYEARGESHLFGIHDGIDLGDQKRQMLRNLVPLDEITESIQPKMPFTGLDENRIAIPTPETLLLPWKTMSGSLYRLFSLQNAVSLGWFLGVFLIWGLCGAVITRTAATQITIGQYSRWSQLKSFLRWRLRSYFAAVLIPVAGLLLCAIAVKIAGWLLMVPVVNLFVAVLFPLVLFLGFCFAILGVGLLFGWPLAFAAVSVDGSDGFDAVSRSYSYVYQRPLQYLVYVVLGIMIGLIGYFFIAWFVDLTLVLVAGWGNAPLTDFMRGRPETWDGWILSFWCWCFRMVKVGFLFGYFWVCSTIIYVILRRSVDGTPIDEIRFPPNDQPGVQKVPDLKTDEKGAPEVVP